MEINQYLGDLNQDLLHFVLQTPMTFCLALHNCLKLSENTILSGIIA